jgi:hypothetical protein
MNYWIAEVIQMEVTKLQAKAFPLHFFRSIPEDQVIEPDDVQEKDSIVTANFGDVTTQIKVDLRNAEVWGRCTCQQYSEQPCIHIKSLAVYRLEELENESEQDETPEDAIEEDVKKLVENGKAIVAEVKPAVTAEPKDTPELGKKRAINMVRSAQATELQLIKKLDDLDEQIAIRDYVAGSAPLVYEIKTKNGVRYELSIRGWIQAMLYQGNIEIVDVKFEQIGDKTVAKAIVRDTARNIQTMGFAERVSNKEFFFTTLASKAIRNALKKIISPSYEQRVIKEAIDARLVLTLSPGAFREVAEP